MYLRALLLIVWIVLLTVPLVAQNQQTVKVVAAVDENTVGTEEVVRYSIEVTGAPASDVQNPRPPQTEGLTLLNPNPAFSQNTSIVNGNVNMTIAFEWSYRPIEEGKARIEGGSITVKGRTYRTEPIEISVVAQAQRPQRPTARRGRSLLDLYRDDETPTERTITDRDLFIQVRPSAQTVFQNEQMNVEYDLYLREGIRIRSNRLADSWDAEGFWREDLDLNEKRAPELEIVNGMRYQVYTLKRIAVFPQRTGDLTIDPLRIETEVAFPLSSRGVFDLFSGTTRFQEATIASPALEIAVKSLPEGAPESFLGAVGSFTMDVAADRTEVEAGETIKLTVTVTGTGNLATLSPPELVLPASVERYDPRVSESINRQRQRVSGAKTFTYVLVPRSSGPHTLPGLDFSYFNPEEGTYSTIQSDPIPIRVTGSLDAAAAARITPTGLPIDDIAGLMALTSWRETGRAPLHRQVWPYAALLLPLLGLIGLYGFRRQKTKLTENVHYARSRRAHPVARKHLKEAESLLKKGQAKAFYEEIDRAVVGFICDRLNISPQGVTVVGLDAHLAARGVPEPIRTDLKVLLHECDRARYAPTPPTRQTMTTATERAATLIAELSERLPQVKAQA